MARRQRQMCIRDSIWPTSIQEKDVNDMILADHDICSIIKRNTHSDLTAKLKLNLWKKI